MAIFHSYVSLPDVIPFDLNVSSSQADPKKQQRVTAQSARNRSPVSEQRERLTISTYNHTHRIHV